jgi:hypothetical protein
VNSKRISRHVVWLLVLVVLVLSCGVSPISTGEVGLNRYISREVVPLSVGLHIDEGIKNLYRDSPQRNLMYIRGKTLSALITRASAKTFKKQTLVSGKETPQELSAKKIEAVVSVKLMAIAGVGSAEPVRWGRTVDAYVTLRWDIASLDGKPVYFCEVMGQGKETVPWGYGAQERRDVYIAALRDHFAKAHKEIVSSGWWKDRSWREE